MTREERVHSHRGTPDTASGKAPGQKGDAGTGKGHFPANGKENANDKGSDDEGAAQGRAVACEESREEKDSQKCRQVAELHRQVNSCKELVLLRQHTDEIRALAKNGGGHDPCRDTDRVEREV